jgi:hypothetical protein
VLERLGDLDQSSLPPGGFDCIYSLSTLEHVPREKTADVWRHMDLLLRSGGEMLHAIDLGFPVKRGLASVLKALAIDAVFPALPASRRRGFIYHTPRAYGRYAVQSVLKARWREWGGLSVMRMILDPEVVTEPMEGTYNRIVKDGMTAIRHVKRGTLLLRLRKRL